MGAYQSFRRYCKNKFFKLTMIFCFNVKETGLRAVVDSVTIIFKI
jgi:predicted ATP-dependent serine protease